MVIRIRGVQAESLRRKNPKRGKGGRALRQLFDFLEHLEERLVLSTAPTITAAEIFGVRPGTPFLFDVTAAGDRPMTFGAVGLPSGLTLNPQTGMITGELTSYATYDLTLTASNPWGSAQQKFRIVVGSQIELTPAMGWNSWTMYQGKVTDAEVRAQAAAMVSTGLSNYGWQYVNVDGGWEGGRTANGQPITGGPAFPNMPALGSYIHSLDLKFGLYTVPQSVGYAGEPAGTSGINIWPDAQEFAEWGVDYLKYDGNPPSQSDIEQMSQALQASGRDIDFSLSYFGGFTATSGNVSFLSSETNSWRVATDITDFYSIVLNDGVSLETPWDTDSGPGEWNDPDSLMVGDVTGTGGSLHANGLTLAQQQSAMSIWSMDAAPLLIGTDLTQLSQATLNILTNPGVIAIDQDPLGIQSVPVDGNADMQWRPLANGNVAVEMINYGDTPSTMTVNFADMGLSGPQVVTDMWAQSQQTLNGSFTATVPVGGTELIELAPATAGAPQIGFEPENQYVNAGNSATFIVDASGAGTLNYQWTRDGVPIQGANSSTYSTAATGAADNGADYRCIVTNGVGQIISYQATLTVRELTTNLATNSYYFNSVSAYFNNTSNLNANVEGYSLTINGTTYGTGIGSAASSEVDFWLGGQDSTFTAVAGIDGNKQGLVDFQVWLDGTKAFDSGYVSSSTSVPINLTVTGADELRLVAVNSPSSSVNAEVDWANPVVTSAPVVNANQLPTVGDIFKTAAYNQTVSFSASDFLSAFTDPNQGQTLQTVKITTLPANGTLMLNGAAVSANQNIAYSQLGNLTYVPTANFIGSDSFGWNGTDLVGFATTGALVHVTIQTPPQPTSPPNAPIITSATPLSNTAVNVSWTDSTTLPNTATSYTVYYSTDGVYFSPAATVAAPASSQQISGLVGSNTYYFKVVGNNSLGASSASNVASATTQAGGTQATTFDLSSGFANAASVMTLNGNATFISPNLNLLNNLSGLTSSAYYNTKQNVSNFVTTFDFQLTGSWPLGDGFTFVIQNQGLNAMGGGGGLLGYGATTVGGTNGVNNSVAIKFDVFSNQGEGTDSTGLYEDGAQPMGTNSIDMSNTGFNLRSYDLSRVTLAYDGTTLTVTMTDTVTGATASQSYVVNIPAVVGGANAWVGFTAGDGSITSYLNIVDWKYGSAANNHPATPTGLTGAAGSKQVTLNWSTVANATSYNLKYGTTSGSYTNTISVPGTSYTLTGLTNNTAYYFAVSAVSAGGEGANSLEASATPVLPLPAAPTGLSATAGNGQVVLSWNSSTLATSYNVSYGTTSGGPYTSTITGISGTGTMVTGLSNYSTYYFVVSGVNTTGAGTASTEASAEPVLPIPAAPTGLSATAGNGQVTLNWNGVTYAAGYNIKYGTTAGGPYTSEIPGFNGTSDTITGLNNYTAYYFVVSAENPTGEGSNSGQASGEPVLPIPAAPTGLNATAGNGQVSLTWNSVSFASSYTVKYGTTSGGPYTSTVTGITGTGTTVSGLNNYSTYYFVVSAVNPTGQGGNSSQASAMPALPIPGTPGGVQATAGNGQVMLNWNSAAYASNYTVKYGTSSGSYTSSLTGVTGTSTVIMGLNNYTTYYFVVMAVNPTGQGSNSAEASAMPVLPIPAAPGGVTATAGNGQVTLGWNSATYASSYNVKYGTTNGTSYNTVISGLTGTGTTITGLTNGTTYYFVVSAVNQTGEGSNSAQAIGLPVLPAPAAPTGVSATAGTGQATVSWNASALATSYNVKYGTTNGSSYNSVVSNLSGTSTIITGLTSGSTYYFVVSGVDASGEGSNSSQASATLGIPAPGAPSGLVATAGNGQVVLAWNSVSGATSYNVKYGTTSGTYTAELTGVSGAGDTVTGLMNGTTYYFVVSAVNGGGEGSNSSPASAEPVLPVPGAPSGLVATAGNGQVVLAWNGVSGATSYNVKYGTTSGTYTAELTGVSGAGDTVTGLTNGTTYYFVVSAVNAGGEGSNSSEANGTPTAPASSTLNYSGGFGSAGSTLAINGSARISGGTLVLTDGGGSEDSSVYATAQQNITTFTAQFDYQISGQWPLGDGFTFVIQRSGVNAVGVAGGGLGYQGIGNSVAIKFDVFDNSGEGNNSTGLFANGAAPTNVGAIDLDGTAFNMRSYDLSRASLSYDGTTLTVVLTDLVTGASVTQHYVVNIPAVIGGGTAWVGFTASDGALTSVQQVYNWTFTSSSSSTPAPSAPSGLTATAGNGQVALTWNSVSGATSYNVKYGTTSGGPYTTTVTGVTTAGTTISGLSNGTAYYFIVTAVNGGGEGTASAEANATPVAPLPVLPSAPSGLSTVSASSQVSLSWNTVSGATSYNVKYGTTSGGPYTTEITGVGTNNETITGLNNGTAYYFVVSAVNAAGEGANSTEVSGNPAAPVIPVPSKPTNLAATAGNGQVALSWDAISGATSYNVKYSTSNGGPYTNVITGVTTNGGTVTGLTNGTTYYFVVSAVNTSGESANSTQANATPNATVTTINYSSGFASASNLTINGSAWISNGALKLTDNNPSEDSSVYYNTQQNVTAFSTQFNFQTTGSWPLGDGFTFVIQRAGLTALGTGGGGLGYQGINNSVAIKFDVFSNAGEGTNSTGLYVNGAAPTVANSIDLDSTGFNLRSYDLSNVSMTYDGTTLTVVLKDLVTGATATQSYVVNIPAIIGGNTAWVGFTAASGSLEANQVLSSWTFTTTP